MQVLYARSMWGMKEPTLEANLVKIKEGGFDAVEMGAPHDAGERKDLRRLLDKLGLKIIVQQWTGGKSPDEHQASFEEQFRRGAELKPLLINSHTGRDIYSAEQNVAILRRAGEIERELAVPCAHEVHRGRATFCTNSTLALLDRLPELKLTADFSHWCCVHESLLQDQPEALERAIARSFHIHARVGHGEAPQVSDPRAPEWKEAVDVHVGWWQRIVARRHAEKAQVMTITPEFGPPGYMPTLPYTRQPVADLWEVNLHMKELLKQRLTA